MQRIITVKLDDVFPLEDEYGNQYASRDYSTKANQAYVRELAESMRMKGVPDEPIAVVEDGGIYRIKTGNSRVMAMRELGTRECPAIIDDEDTVQSVLEAVVRTDTKKKYEPVERSRFVQQLAMFGDDQYVSEVSGIEPEKVKRIRKARMVVDDAGDDMTIERMLLIEEFCDDPEAVKALTNCKENEANWTAENLRRKRAAKERQDAFIAAFELQGVPVVRDRSEIAGMSYFILVTEPAKVADYLPREWEPGQVKALVGTGTNQRAELYVVPELADDDEDEERAELRRQSDAYREAIAQMDEDRKAWFFGNLANGRPMRNVEREAAEAFAGLHFVEDAMAMLNEEAKAAIANEKPSKRDIAIGYFNTATGGTTLAGAIASGKLESYQRGHAAAYLDMLVMHQADGWSPGDGHAIVAAISKLVDGEEKESEGEDD